MAQNDAKSFALQIDAAMADKKEDLSLLLRTVALDALSKLVMRSRVDTGRLRNGFDIGIGSFGSYKAPEAQEVFDKTGGEAINRAATALASYPIDRFPVINVTNNVNYAGFREQKDNHIPMVIAELVAKYDGVTV